MKRVGKLLQLPSVHDRGIRGKHVVTAVLDTGVYLHPDLKGKVKGFADVTSGNTAPYDDNGHGTHICGIIAGSRWGIAPDCGLVVVKVLDQYGHGTTAQVLEGLHWVLAFRQYYHIKIVNISIGTRVPDRPEEMKELIETVEQMWDTGMVVVSSAGNNGPRQSSITVPGVSRKIITVGAMDDSLGRPGLHDYSGRGPTKDCVVKPEIVTYGTEIHSCSHQGKGYREKSGTSMATAIVSGSIALGMSAYPHCSNNQIKRCLKQSARPLELSPRHQGWGALDLEDFLTCIKNENGI